MTSSGSEPDAPPSPLEQVVADLDAQVAAGRITFDQYWDARIEAERHAETAAQDRSFDLPHHQHGLRPAGDPPFADGPYRDPTMVPPPPPGAARPVTPPPPVPLVPPPPPPNGYAQPWVSLPFDAPNRDAAPTRPTERRRRFRRRSP